MSNSYKPSTPPPNISTRLEYTIPKGYNFAPHDDDMIYYLLKKSRGQPLPEEIGRNIVERRLHGEEATPWNVLLDDDPWQCFMGPRKRVIYVFCKLIPVNGKSTSVRVCRTAGCGKWDGKAVPQEIKIGQRVIGLKKTFSFKPKKEFEKEMEGRRWIMHEFSLPASARSDLDQENYVICRITKEVIKKDGSCFDDGDDDIDSLPGGAEVGCDGNLRVLVVDSGEEDHDDEMVEAKKISEIGPSNCGNGRVMAIHSYDDFDHEMLLVKKKSSEIGPSNYGKRRVSGIGSCDYNDEMLRRKKKRSDIGPENRLGFASQEIVPYGAPEEMNPLASSFINVDNSNGYAVGFSDHSMQNQNQVDDDVPVTVDYLAKIDGSNSESDPSYGYDIEENLRKEQEEFLAMLRKYDP